MSRSIKQYKEAMDSLNISESFSKRTETLLLEAEEKENMSPVRQNKTSRTQITMAACAGLAACLIAVIALRAGRSDSSMIESGDAGVTAVTSSVAETSGTSLPTAGFADEEIIVSLENEDEQYVRANDPAVEMLQPVESAPDADGGAGAAAAPDAADSAQRSEEGLYSLDYSQIEAELVSYVNGKRSVTAVLTGENAWNLVSPVAYVVYGTEELEENGSFISEFVLILNDKKTGDTFYTIYINEAGTVVLTDHTGEAQVRKSFLPEKKNFEDIEKAMFLCLGSEREYEVFINGKNS